MFLRAELLSMVILKSKEALQCVGSRVGIMDDGKPHGDQVHSVSRCAGKGVLVEVLRIGSVEKKLREGGMVVVIFGIVVINLGLGYVLPLLFVVWL